MRHLVLGLFAFLRLIASAQNKQKTVPIGFLPLLEDALNLGVRAA